MLIKFKAKRNVTMAASDPIKRLNYKFYFHRFASPFQFVYILKM